MWPTQNLTQIVSIFLGENTIVRRGLVSITQFSEIIKRAQLRVVGRLKLLL